MTKYRFKSLSEDFMRLWELAYRTLYRFCIHVGGSLHASLNEHSLARAGRFFFVIIFFMVARAERLFARPWLFLNLSAFCFAGARQNSPALPGFLFWLFRPRVELRRDATRARANVGGRAAADSIFSSPHLLFNRYWLRCRSGQARCDIE